MVKKIDITPEMKTMQDKPSSEEETTSTSTEQTNVNNKKVHEENHMEVRNRLIISDTISGNACIHISTYVYIYFLFLVN